MKNIENLLKKIDDFPTLPTIYTSLISVISNPRSSVQDLANVIIKDQAVTTNILKVVNSSVYGVSEQVDTVSKAVFYLGFNEVKNIVLAISVIDIFKKIQNQKGLNLVDLWKHSLAVGVTTKALSHRLGINNSENFFISGIIHEIGKLFFFNFYKEEYLNLINDAIEQDIELHKLENKYFGFNHLYIGNELAKIWKLPLPIKNAIKFHQFGLIDGKFDSIVACVHLANIIAEMIHLGTNSQSSIPQPNFKIWDYLNFPPDTLTNMYDELISNYEESESILSLN